MNITTLQENLLRSLQFVGKTISTKPQLPILSNIYLKAENGRLTLASTNLEITSVVHLDVKINQEGAITVPAKPFIEYITTLDPGALNLVLSENSLIVTTTTNEAHFVTIPATEFPPLPTHERKNELELGVSDFLPNLSFVATAAGTDEARPVLTGVYAVGNGKKIVLAATDGFRLSVVEQSIPSVFDEKLIIPARIFSDVFQTAKAENSKTVTMSLSKEQNQIFFSFADKHVVTRLIEGEFPNYEKIIPKNNTTTVVFDHSTLLGAVKTSLVFARASSNLIKVKCEKETVTISANAAQIGENKTTLEARVEGEGGEIAFNSRFLIDFLSVFKEDRVVFEMSGSHAPGVFKSEKNPSLLHIIMPVRVQG